ncbi:MAG: AMIN domain-containing protein [Desulfopila sp.]
MKYFVHLFLAFLTSCCTAFAAGQNDVTIQSISFQQQEQREIVQIRLSGGVEPETFELKGEQPRFVLDFPATVYPSEQPRIIAAEGGFVKRIRVGVHAAPTAKTRVVLDLVKDVPLVFSREYRLSDTTYRVIISSEQTVSARQDRKSGPGLHILPETPSAVDDDTDSAGVADTEVSSIKPTSAPASPTMQPDTKNTGAKTTPEKIEKTEKAGETEQRQAVKGKHEEGTPRQSPPKATKKPATKKPLKEGPKLVDVSYERSTNDKEMVLFQLNGFYPPMVYSAESNELLVVCEFDNGVVEDGVEPVLETGGVFINTVEVRSMEAPRKIRVLLTLRGNATYDLKQVFFKEDNLFVVIISKLGDNGSAN